MELQLLLKRCKSNSKCFFWLELRIYTSHQPTPTSSISKEAKRKTNQKKVKKKKIQIAVVCAVFVTLISSTYMVGFVCSVQVYTSLTFLVTGSRHAS